MVKEDNPNMHDRKQIQRLKVKKGSREGGRSTGTDRWTDRKGQGAGWIWGQEKERNNVVKAQRPQGVITRCVQMAVNGTRNCMQSGSENEGADTKGVFPSLPLPPPQEITWGYRSGNELHY